MPVTIEHQVAIYRTDGDQRISPAWQVIPIVVEDINFVEIKSTRCLCRFLTGNSDYWQIPALALLKQARTKASISLGDDGDCALFEATAASQKAMRAQCLHMQALGTLPKIVSVNLPTIGSTDGIQARCLTDLDYNSALRVELTEEVIEYIVGVCMHERSNGLEVDRAQKSDTKKRRCSGHRGVTWHSQKSAWVARRCSPGSTARYKTFRPNENDATAIDEAADIAAQWARGEIECDGEDDIENEDSGEKV